ncbi:hypothetical protein J7E99_30115 [Streptomyces sp. ISL-44]|uniref:hypothetical protein n=1 Tax=Streptomyces sp. ISL-44 TaxID=2819184 RepID=UPI001BECDAF6|nr:hypothetical protein [Streptomyces sp. ISL-44]MBT2544848.1 hypothetical protein [Streptomyces sp. ISL-44]
MALEQDPGPTEEDEILPCGASLALLWDDGAPPAGHTDCVDCQNALEELARLHTLVDRAVAESPHNGEGLAERVMQVVRTELRPGPLLPLGELDEDSWITQATAARVLRGAVDRLPGVTAGSCELRPLSVSGDGRLPGGRLPRGPLQVRIEIAVSPDLDLTFPRVAGTVRARLSTVAAEELGIDVRQIDVAVVDLLAGPAEADGRSGT